MSRACLAAEVSAILIYDAFVVFQGGDGSTVESFNPSVFTSGAVGLAPDGGELAALVAMTVFVIVRVDSNTVYAVLVGVQAVALIPMLGATGFAIPI